MDAGPVGAELSVKVGAPVPDPSVNPFFSPLPRNHPGMRMSQSEIVRITLSHFQHFTHNGFSLSRTRIEHPRSATPPGSQVPILNPEDT